MDQRNKKYLASLIIGLLYGLICRLYYEYDPHNEGLRIMSASFIFGVPAIVGALVVFLGNLNQKKSWKYRIFAPWISILLFAVALFFMLEAILCVVMLMPAFFLSASVGGIIAGFLIDIKKSNTAIISFFVIIPFFTGIIESKFPNTRNIYKVETTTLINSDYKTVWNNIKSVSLINEDELPMSFAHSIGVPSPLCSSLDKEQVGGIRSIKWEKGVRFKEIITDWDEFRSFSYSIVADTIPPDAIDKHVEIGGQYFSVNKGGYEIKKVTENKTMVKLSCEYQVTSKFNFYCRFWSDILLDDFQVVILKVIKNRCENNISR